MQWIAMKDRTPKTEGRYLVYAPSADDAIPFYYVAWWNDKGRRWEAIHSIWADAVTHWTPLTPPSK